MTALIDKKHIATKPRKHPYQQTEEVLQILFVRLAELPKDGSDAARVRERIIRAWLPYAHRLARRFDGRGEHLDDLRQVAALALVKAVDGFDVDRRARFYEYAIPTILGELKRHFRDRGWTMRVRRRTQELRLRIRDTLNDLSQQLRRSPTPRDIADELGVSVHEVNAALNASNAYRPLSLDAPIPGSADITDKACVGAADRALAEFERRELVRPLLESLPPREQRIVVMRFYGEMTQCEIAEQVGLSQMHVSRLLASSCNRMRRILDDQTAP